MSDRSRGASLDADVAVASAKANVEVGVGLTVGEPATVLDGNRTTGDVDVPPVAAVPEGKVLVDVLAANALAAPKIMTDAKIRLRTFIPHLDRMKANSHKLVANVCIDIVSEN